MNKALIAKLGWRVLNDKESLWARVLRCKYKVGGGGVQDRSWLSVKSNWSSTWRSVGTGLRDVVNHGLSWVLGDGQQVCFWTDKWLLGKPLLDSVVGPLPENYEKVKAAEMWVNGSGWVLDRILPHVSANTRLDLAAVVLDNVTGARDCISWGECSDGKFSVKSAYELITRDHTSRPNMDSFYRRVWSLSVPERVRVYFWLLGNQAVMSNEERMRRHLCDSDICQGCKSRTSRGQRCLLWQFGGDGSGDAGMCFGENGKCRDRVRFIKDLSKEVAVANVASGSKASRTGRVERRIGLVKPQSGWVKLNTDGASRGNPGLATTGGVLRDEAGEYCGGFAVNIGKCTAPLAELWGVYYGLYIAWEKQITQVELEVDSELVVGFLKTGIDDSHPLSFLVRLCHGFIAKDWTVRVSHVYREANRLADGLANYAFTLPLGFHALSVVPIDFASIVREDALGFTQPRQILL
ncbi:Ribonuclease H domain [Arabidopsis thaliana x Arabidopsis arenosa]|uniref:Ribonuclease H domain n=1 Tax=Arabidopsis thaliana x Arabidopsis arenosa TaxID=1240361 RepID=A0A8T2A3H9_9BRAS|nr:Ribonuclease H domain [Arabidopsis thaliana x Arabidopsis arenosa]